MKQILKNVWKALTEKERRRFSLLAVFHVITSAADIAGLALLVVVIGIYTGEHMDRVTSFLPAFLMNKNSLWPLFVLLLFFMIKNYAGYFVNQQQCLFITNVASRISNDKLARYLHGNYSCYIQTEQAVNIREISYHPAEFSQYILNGLQQIITQATLVLLAVTAILLFKAKLFLLLLPVLLPPVILVFYFIRKRSWAISDQARTTSEKTLLYLQEALSGFVESNLYHKAFFFLERYTGQQRRYNRSVSDALVLQEMPGRIIELFALLGLFFMIVLSRWYHNDHAIIITIGAFIAAAYKIIPGLVKILNISGQVRSYAFTVEKEQHPATAFYLQNNSMKGRNITCLQLENVIFSYDGRRILDEINFKLQRGDFACLTGPSGKGKTTLLNLLLGFMEPDVGHILINGHVSHLQMRKQYRKYMAYVRQEPFLIQGSVLQNILLDDHCSDKRRLDEVIEAAGLTEMIAADPAGLHKMIMENGRNISGGQRQRIALARALYKKDSAILLLDEPFSELDEQSEYRMLDYLRGLAQQGRMILLVSHHSRGLPFCNKILSLYDRETENIGSIKSGIPQR